MTKQIKDKKAIEHIAKRIAHDIMSVNTDFRGNLLELVAAELKNNAQGYTGNVMADAARDYGVNDDL